MRRAVRKTAAAPYGEDLWVGRGHAAPSAPIPLLDAPLAVVDVVPLCERPAAVQRFLFSIWAFVSLITVETLPPELEGLLLFGHYLTKGQIH